MATYAAKLRQEDGSSMLEIGSKGQVLKTSGGNVTGQVALSRTGGTTKDGTNGAIPLTHAVVSVTTGAASAYSLANGYQGQVLTMVVTTDGGEGTVTPVTATGWVTAVFTDDIDTLTVMFINTSIGWIVIGAAGDGTNMVALTQ
jgi:hypothetical protein